MIQPGLGTEPFSFPEKKGGGPCGSSETTEINRAEKKLWEEERPAQGEGVLLPTGSWEAGAGGGKQLAVGVGAVPGIAVGLSGFDFLKVRKEVAWEVGSACAACFYVDAGVGSPRE